MTHLKRQKVPKNWPIHRKGNKFVVRSNFNLEQSIPLLIILRDLLKIAQNRKEVKRAIKTKQVLVNSRPVADEKRSILLFDKISIVPSKKYYELGLTKNGKFKVIEIKENETGKKISKVKDKKVLKGKKTQLNLADGRNFLSELKCKVNDSVVIDFKKKELEKCLPIKENAKVLIFGGKHSGTEGIIEKVKEERKMASVKTENEKLNVLIKQLIVIE